MFYYFAVSLVVLVVWIGILLFLFRKRIDLPVSGKIGLSDVVAVASMVVGVFAVAFSIGFWKDASTTADQQTQVLKEQTQVLQALTRTAENQVSILESQKKALDESAAALKVQVEIARKQETRTESELARRPDPKLWLYVNWEEYKQDRKGEAVYKLRRRAGGKFTITLYLANEGLKPVEKPSLKLFYWALDEELSPVLSDDCVGSVGPDVFREPDTSINVEDGTTISLKTDSYKPLSQIKRSYRYFLDFKCPEDARDFRLTVMLEGNNINTMERTALVHLPPLPPPPPKIPAGRVAGPDTLEVIGILQLEDTAGITIAGREIHGPPFLPTSRKR